MEGADELMLAFCFGDALLFKKVTRSSLEEDMLPCQKPKKELNTYKQSIRLAEANES